MNVTIGGIARTVEITSFDKLGDVKVCMLTTTADGSVGFQQLNQEVIDAIDSKAVPDGTYEDMVVGSAEQLLSTQYDTDSVPYAFRKSPYGDREFDEIVGGSIAWNQCCPTANINVSETNYTVVSNNDGKWTITVTAQTTSVGHNYQWVGATTFIANHVYAFLGSNGNIQIQLKAYTKSSDTIFKPTTSVGNNVTVVFTNLAVGTYVVYPQLFDLTQMFGSTVADAIYAMEQSSSGSGVAWFRSLFPKPYYAYNAGELISVSGLSAHKTTGFNQLSLEGGKGTLSGYANTTPRAFEYDKYYIGITANNYYNEGTVSSYHVDSTTGEVTATASSNGYGVAFPIRVFANTNYYVTATVAKGNGQIRMGYYDESGVLISYSPANVIGQVVTTPVNCKTMLVVISTSSAPETFTLNNICINISGERNGEYEPYESQSYALDDSLTLRGVPKLNSANEMYFDGDVYASDGTVQRRFGIVTLNGSETWGMNATSHNGYLSMNSVKRVSDYRLSMISSYLPVVAQAGDTSTSAMASWVSAYYNNGTNVGKNWIYVHIDGITTVADLKAYLANKPLTLVYELATPTTESAESYQNPQICNEYGTEEYISAEQNGVTMIVGHNTKYPQNLRKKIEGLPWNFSNLIAPTEVTNKATRNYTVGSFLIMNNTLYKVTSAIANGGTITVGTNVNATTIMQEILAL